MGHKNLNKVPVSRKSFGKGVSLGIIEGMVAAPAFNATHQTSWLHLCGENPWTVLPWPLQFTRGLGRCLMGQALKWWTRQSTNRGIRLPEGSYIMWETFQRAGDWQRKHCSIKNSNCNQIQEKYIQELLSLDIVEEEFLCTTFFYSLFFLTLLPSLAH